MGGSYVMKVYESISNQSLTVHQLSSRCGMDYRTVKGCLDIITQIQESPKIIKDLVGLRVVVKKER
jgi:hypothetical protein